MNSERSPYLPFLKRPEVVTLGISQLDMSRWIEPDTQFARYYNNKCALIEADKAACFLEQPGSLDAQQELAGRLLEHLLRDHSSFYQRSEDSLYIPTLQQHIPIYEAESPLQDASFWVQDDICLLQEIDKRYCLTAASVCAPSAWQLEEKIGKPMFDIHQPVPGLNEKIGGQIDHVFDKLTVLRPLQRFNWGITDSSQLAKIPRANGISVCVANSDVNLYLRVERQTLTRLPLTGAIVFTIRVYIYALEELVGIPGALQGLKQAVEKMSTEEVDYKSILPLYPRFRKFVKQALRSEPVS